MALRVDIAPDLAVRTQVQIENLVVKIAEICGLVDHRGRGAGRTAGRQLDHFLAVGDTNAPEELITPGDIGHAVDDCGSGMDEIIGPEAPHGFAVSRVETVEITVV